MLRAGCVGAAIVVAAALTCVCAAGADMDAREQARVLVFSGTDLWRQGSFLYGGTVWAPFGLDSDGIAVKLLTTRGVYSYRSGALGNADVFAVMNAAALMPGVHFTRGGVSVAVYAGADHQEHVLVPDDIANPARGHHTGIRVAGELWTEPTAQTMVTGSAMLSTIGSAYAMRAAVGWRLYDVLYVGPELNIYGAENYRQWRLGVHLTGLKLKNYEFQAAVGYAEDDESNNGLYVRLSVMRKHW
jgi:hypothetical protein